MTAHTIRAFLNQDDGQDLIEYALLAGLVSLVAVAAVLNVGGSINQVWVGVEGQMAAVPAP